MEIDFLEKVAIKMVELYARETQENYDEELKDKIYKLLREM